PVVDPERRPDDDPFADLAEQLAEEPVAELLLRVAGCVLSLHQLLRARRVGLDLGVAGEVELAAKHPLLHLRHPGTVIAAEQDGSSDARAGTNDGWRCTSLCYRLATRFRGFSRTAAWETSIARPTGVWAARWPSSCWPI